MHHWGILSTGGVLIGLVSIWQMTGHGVSPLVGWAIGGLAVLGACFKAWNEQLERAEALIQERTKEDDLIDLPPPPPQIAQVEAAIAEEESPKLTIQTVSVRKTGLVPGNYGTITEHSQGNSAVVISFKNQPSPIPGQQTDSFYNVTANLTYVGTNRTEHVDYGNWLDEYTRCVDFRPGETRDLVIAMKDRSGIISGLYNRKKHNPMKARFHSGGTLYGPDFRPLPDPPCEVTVTLVSDNTTLLSERYRLNWAEGQMEISRLENVAGAK